MTSKLTIFLIEKDISTRNDITSVLNSNKVEVGKLVSAADLQEGIRLFQNDEPHIVFLQVRDIEQGVRETAYLVSRFPQATVIVTATEKNPDWILNLVRAGAAEYLTKPVIAAELMAALYKITRQHVLKTDPVVSNGTVISLYNPSGGMGTTTIAVNLAASLAEKGETVALLDFNLCSSDISPFLDLSPRYTLSNVAARQGNFDASFLNSILVRHSSGMHVLCGPDDIEEASAIRTEHIRETVSILKSLFSFTIVDTGGQLFGYNLELFKSSDLVLYVAQLNVPVLNNAKRHLSCMINEGLSSSRVKLIINRQLSKDEIKVSDAEKILNTRAYKVFPNAYFDVKTSINKGVPLVTSNPRSIFAKAVEELAGELIRNDKGKSKSAMLR
jgi:pilus assembly protein CpaE